MSDEHSRELGKDELNSLPETTLKPPASRLTYEATAASREGAGFDNLDPSAVLDRYFEGPQNFEEVANWYDERLRRLGWPAGVKVENSSRKAWYRWRRDLESVDLIDRLVEAGSSVGQLPRPLRGFRLPSELPTGWSCWSVTYKRAVPPDLGEVP